jgi:hypothetical protein
MHLFNALKKHTNITAMILLKFLLWHCQDEHLYVKIKDMMTPPISQKKKEHSKTTTHCVLPLPDVFKIF